MIVDSHAHYAHSGFSGSFRYLSWEENWTVKEGTLEELMDQIRQLATDALYTYLDRDGDIDRMEMKNKIKDDVSKYLYAKTRRKPMILPVIMNM